MDNPAINAPIMMARMQRMLNGMAEYRGETGSQAKELAIMTEKLIEYFEEISK
tara:strand:- start:11243 stop:11401 length:159 start_codon:yes stop_codon:yes gene_type:complete